LHILQCSPPAVGTAVMAMCVRSLQPSTQLMVGGG